ncbi:MAG: hypothetical protein CMM93_08995 [Rickettsiales bacterium]|nr:hypothetical protein [Rickettsiales bacterium]MAR57306.1 hypothetical protein [Rickettsiales bacterium]|tara:strand:+ start:521 stop:763 length:243 start_codon:yes stop_codon:yes gene_type:complete
MATATKPKTDAERVPDFTNIPMTDAEHRAFMEQDAKWSGPKLIITAFITLGFAFTVLYLSSAKIIGPTFHDGRPAAAAHD